MYNPNRSYDDPDDVSLYPMDARLVGGEDATLISTLMEFNLVLTFQIPLNADGSPNDDQIFYAELDSCINRHLSDHHLRFSKDPSRPTSASAPAPGDNTNIWHAKQF